MHTDDSITKSESDSANAKPYKHTDDCSTKSEWDSAVLEGLVRARYSAEMAVAVG